MLDLGWRSAARRLRRNQARRGFFAFRARWRDGAIGARVAVGVTLRGFIRDTADCRRWAAARETAAFFCATRRSACLSGFSRLAPSHSGVLLPPASCASRRNPRTWARGRAVKATVARARAAPPRGCSVNHITHQQQQRSASRCARRGVRPRRRAARGAASAQPSRASTRPRRRREGPRRARPRRTRQWRSTTPFDRPQSGIRAPPRDIKRLL